MRLRLATVILAGCLEVDPGDQLQDRLNAPCCPRQTLRDHESPAARELRAELSQRLAAGEHPDGIERDLVTRYGERIRALPEGRDPRWLVGAIAGIAAIGGLFVSLRIGKRRPPPATAPSFDPEELDRLEDRLDDELAKVD